MALGRREGRPTGVAPGDEDALLDVVGDDRVTVWLSHDSRSRDQVRAILAGAAALPELDRVVGLAGLGLGGVQAAKLGYAIRADEWGKGYATPRSRARLWRASTTW